LVKVGSVRKVMLVAGDPSGDGHAARVVAALSRLAPKTRVFGMGGPRLAAAGMDVREDLTREALVGFVEVAKHLPQVFRRFRQCEEWLDRERPDLLVLVDYPGFNLRLAAKAAKRGIPVCYYIAPQVWAWHKDRLAAMRRDLKKLLVIFPFEQAWFRKEGIDATYVGHPLMETVSGIKKDAKKVRKELGLSEGAVPLVAILPGSRKSELKKIWPPLLKAARLMAAQQKDAVFLVPKPTFVSEEDYPGLLPTDPIVFVEGPAWETRAICDVAWVKSGTSTVETALLGTPQIVVYKVAAFSAFLAKRLLKLGHVGMVNLLSKKPTVPELLQEAFTPKALVAETEKLLEGPFARRDQLRQFAEIRKSLSKPKKPAETAAKEILKLMKSGG